MFNRSFTKFAAVLALSATLVSVGANASYAGSPPKPLIGGLLGGAVGAGAGMALGKGEGAIIGGLMGAALGAIVADRIDSHDRHHGDRVYDGYIPPSPTYDPAVYQQPTYQPAPVVYQQPVYQGVEYQQASPYPVYGPAYGQADQGQYCRPFNANVAVDGQQMVSQGTACLQQDGTWKLLN